MEKEKNINKPKILNISEIEEFCEQIYKNFTTEPDYSDIIKKYTKIFEDKIIGQQAAKNVIYDILEQIKADLVLREEGYNKPIASILFAGPSGVGKTKMARIMQKALNEFFHENNEIIKINCADFQGEQPFSLTRLIGASAGYIGSDKKPKFHPDNIKGKGRIILFDEIEKAGTPLKNLLLSILDDGVLEVNYVQPKEVDNVLGIPLKYEKKDNQETSYIKSFFTDKVIILTSNIGLNKIDEELNKKQLGFSTSKKKENTKEINNYIPKIIKEELSNHFKLELQGRFDYIVPFTYFEKDDTKKLVDIQIDNILKEILNKHGFIVIFSSKIKNKILDEIINSKDYKKYGGRFIEGYFKKKFVTPLAQIVNQKSNNKNNKEIIYITEKNNKIIFSLIPQNSIV